MVRRSRNIDVIVLWNQGKNRSVVKGICIITINSANQVEENGNEFKGPHSFKLSLQNELFNLKNFPTPDGNPLAAGLLLRNEPQWIALQGLDHEILLIYLTRDYC